MITLWDELESLLPVDCGADYGEGYEDAITDVKWLLQEAIANDHVGIDG